MSIQTEVDRINGAVSDQVDLISQIQTALEGKLSPAPLPGDAVTEKITIRIRIGYVSDTSRTWQFGILPDYLPIQDPTTLLDQNQMAIFEDVPINSVLYIERAKTGSLTAVSAPDCTILRDVTVASNSRYTGITLVQPTGLADGDEILVQF